MSDARTELRTREALAGVARGWSYTPLSGKVPTLKAWQSDPRTTPGEVERWAHAGNVGVRTGSVSGVVVVDVDTAKGGVAPEGLPRTVTVETGGGGFHHYFRCPEGGLPNSVGRLAPHVDVRGDGGQVVAVGSVHPDTGRVYVWAPGLSPEDVPLAELPADVVRALREPKAKAAPPPATRETVPTPARGTPYGFEALRRECDGVATAPEGTRNARLNEAAFNLGQLLASADLADEGAVAAALTDAATRAGLDVGEIAPTIASGLAAGRGTPRTRHTLPTIIVGPDLGRVVGEAESALGEHSPKRVFVRAGRLVILARDGKPSAKALRRPEDAVHVHALGPEALRELLSASARWVRREKAKADCDEAKKGDDVDTDTVPPPWVSHALAQRGEWSLPYLVGLIHGPAMRANGSLLVRPGYDADSGLFAAFDPAAFPAIADRPTLDDARAAVATLREPFCDFPYVSGADASVDLAAVLSLVGRDAIDGPVPLFALDAPTRGSGKTLRADVVALVATGRKADVSIPSSDPDEQRKALLAVALEGHALVLFDNVTDAFGSGTLAAYLTASEVRDRRLGVSETASAPWRAVPLVTGNNLAFRGDVGRRVLLSTIDPRCEHAEDRTGWTHDPLREWVGENRARIYAAALVLLRAFVVAGRPKHGLPPMGSFEAWDRLVRGALLWVGAADPCGTRERVREDADADLDVVRALLGAWRVAFADGRATIGDAVRLARDGAHPVLKDALAAIAPRRSKDGDALDARAIGNGLRKLRGRIVGGRRLVESGSRDGSRLYRVETIEALAEGDSGDLGDLFPRSSHARAPACAHTYVIPSGGTTPLTPLSPLPTDREPGEEG